eukprot:4710258-Amphidinium_carterae.1
MDWTSVGTGSPKSFPLSCGSTSGLGDRVDPYGDGANPSPFQEFPPAGAGARPLRGGYSPEVYRGGSTSQTTVL